MNQEEEYKNRRIGWGISLGFHALLIALFFLILAWREPDPPVPEYGIELNFGLDAAGSGDIQPSQQAAPAEQSVEETTEETQEPAEETSPPEPIEESIPEENILEEIQTQEEPSDVHEEPAAAVKEPEKSSEKIDREEVQKPVEKSTPVEKPDETSGTPSEETATNEASSQGDRANVTGDQGDPQGTIDSRALYGSQGGGGGPMLDLAGWTWDFVPKPNDTSNENGKIVFQIKINERGEVLSVVTLEKTVSPDIERIYKREVERLTFSPISINTVPAPVSTGKITFIIRSK